MVHSPACRFIHLGSAAVPTALLALLALGCAAGNPPGGPIPGPQLRGRVHGGQQPVSGASIQLFAAGAAAYGAGAVSLLAAPVHTDANGGFSLGGDYTCSSPASQLYLLASGGNPGLAPGTDNHSLAMIAALGPCKFIGSQYLLDPSTFINIDEVTTVASVYALAGFMDPVTNQVGASSTNAIGLANAFQTVNNLVDTATGQARTTTPAGNGTVPQAELDTLADILAPCINSDGAGAACSTLFAAATPSGGAAPTNTLQATLSIAQHPASQVAALYNQAAAIAPFQPTLAATPNDWTVQLAYTAYGSTQMGIAIDASGDVWITNNFTSNTNTISSVTEFSNNGTILSGPAGFTAGGISDPLTIAIDPSDNVWIYNTLLSGLTKLSNTGTPLSGLNGIYGFYPRFVIDGFGNIWFGVNGALNKLDNNGNLLSGSGYTGGGLVATTLLSIDTAENVWAANPAGYTGGGRGTPPTPYDGRVAKFTNAGVPLSGTGGFSIPTLFTPTGNALANDNAGNVWIAGGSAAGAGIFKLAPDGTILSGGNGYIGGGLISPAGIAIDGAGSAWTVSGGYPPTPTSIVELDNSGTFLSGATGFSLPTILPVGIAVDNSGNVWVAMTYGLVYELVGAATPVTTPLSVGVRDKKLGARP